MRFDMKGVWRRGKSGAKPGHQADNALSPFDTYEPRIPSQQNAIDAIDGWVSAFPKEYGVAAGKLPLFHDSRIQWAVDRFGTVNGKNILELGPLEAAHTTLLHKLGARITAVEANKQAYLKCLITKEIVGLPNARFLLGDCVQYLEAAKEPFDMIFACGVLYHMIDPLRFLEALSAKSDSLYIWTMFVDEGAGPSDESVAANWARVREEVDFHGAPVTLYRRGYLGANKNADFSGGIFNEPRWMSRASILAALKALGYNSLTIEHEKAMYPYESSLSVFARRT